MSDPTSSPFLDTTAGDSTEGKNGHHHHHHHSPPTQGDEKEKEEAELRSSSHTAPEVEVGVKEGQRGTLPDRETVEDDNRVKSSPVRDARPDTPTNTAGEEREEEDKEPLLVHSKDQGNADSTTPSVKALETMPLVDLFAPPVIPSGIVLPTEVTEERAPPVEKEEEEGKKQIVEVPVDATSPRQSSLSRPQKRGRKRKAESIAESTLDMSGVDAGSANETREEENNENSTVSQHEGLPTRHVKTDKNCSSGEVENEEKTIASLETDQPEKEKKRKTEDRGNRVAKVAVDPSHQSSAKEKEMDHTEGLHEDGESLHQLEAICDDETKQTLSELRCQLLSLFPLPLREKYTSLYSTEAAPTPPVPTQTSYKERVEAALKQSEGTVQLLDHLREDATFVAGAWHRYHLEVQLKRRIQEGQRQRRYRREQLDGISSRTVKKRKPLSEAEQELYRRGGNVLRTREPYYVVMSTEEPPSTQFGFALPDRQKVEKEEKEGEGVPPTTTTTTTTSSRAQKRARSGSAATTKSRKTEVFSILPEELLTESQEEAVVEAVPPHEGNDNNDKEEEAVDKEEKALTVLQSEHLIHPKDQLLYRTHTLSSGRLRHSCPEIFQVLTRHTKQVREMLRQGTFDWDRVPTVQETLQKMKENPNQHASSGDSGQ